MFADIEIKEPIEKVADDWDYLNDRVISRFAAFRASGHNIFGLRRRVISKSGTQDAKKGSVGTHLSLGPQGIIVGTQPPLSVRITTAGTPHRVPHSFGYWHINDKDELYLQIPGAEEGEPGCAVVIMGLAKEKETDSFAWYCEECLTLLYDFVVETGRDGFNEFWRGEREAVRSYNSDVHKRTCPECSHINPMGYCWNTAKDSPNESAARKIW